MPINSLNRALNTVVLFGVFEADLRSDELRKGGVKVKIQDLPFRALKLLLSRPNQVITREEFRQTLWPGDVFVDFDLGIRSAIKRLRDALGDSARIRSSLRPSTVGATAGLRRRTANRYRRQTSLPSWKMRIQPSPLQPPVPPSVGIGFGIGIGIGRSPGWWRQPPSPWES